MIFLEGWWGRRRITSVATALLFCVLLVLPNPGAADQPLVPEVEPNGTTATATSLGGTGVVARGNVFPNGDVDFYSFTANAGDRVYAAVMTSFSASGNLDSTLELIDTDGVTSLELDTDDGVFGALSSSIAGATLLNTGTHYLRVIQPSGTTQLRPYDLHLQVRSGLLLTETEPNDVAPGQALPTTGWVAGELSAANDVDLYSISLNAGDTVFLSLDLDPERDAVEWNGEVGLGDFGGQILALNDSGSASPDSEAFFMTVLSAGTYTVRVRAIAATFGTYHLSASVHPATPATATCTTYTSTDVPQMIPDSGLAQSTLTIPGNPRIADVNLTIQLTHAFMSDLDVHLVSPEGNDNGVFTDIGSASSGVQTAMNLTFDDEGALPPSFSNTNGMVLTPELAYRLSWFDGEDAGGTWTLALRDDASNDVGTLTSWSLTICEPPAAPACAPGTAPVTAYSSDFESDDGGFTHSGVQDEWERGLPTLGPITTCNSGGNCWKTDLDGTYNPSSNQDLLSANIDLSGLVGPIIVTWAQRYQMESATFDHYSVDFQEVGGANPTRLFEWLDATMTNTVGIGPTVVIEESAGWGIKQADVSSYAGLNAEIRFHLDSDTTVQKAGVAIDDVTVTGCEVVPEADLAITKTDGVTMATAGESVTYTIVASNAGPQDAFGATVSDTFPAVLTCTWVCAPAGGGVCPASGTGDLNESVDLPAGGSVTFTVICAIDPAATGMLINVATVEASEPDDPNEANNTASDTDTLVATSADLAITKTDGVTMATPGESLMYTIVASNAGPQDALGATVSDTFPAVLSCTWMCVGASGGVCPASGMGNLNESVDLPAGASVTFTVGCAINPAATGTLINVATVGVSDPDDPNDANNSAADTDTLVPSADLSITKSGTVTNMLTASYTIVASNTGPSSAPSATVTDMFPPALSCMWTCTGANGGSCPAAGSGDINVMVSLPPNASVTFSVMCTVDPSASGDIVNTATIGSTIEDPVGDNNSATDTDPIIPVVPPAPVPALSWLGFGIALATLLGVARWRLRYRGR